MVRKWEVVTAGSDALTKTFLSIGKKRGVSEDLLLDVLDLLMKNQYLAKGDRIHVRTQLKRMIQMHEGK
jgi:hypothetical protein